MTIMKHCLLNVEEKTSTLLHETTALPTCCDESINDSIDDNDEDHQDTDHYNQL